MKTEDLNDDLLPEYDLTKLKVRRIGPGRKALQENRIRLDIDVARVFPDSDSVNKALRFLIQMTKQNPVDLTLK